MNFLIHVAILTNCGCVTSLCMCVSCCVSCLCVFCVCFLCLCLCFSALLTQAFQDHVMVFTQTKKQAHRMHILLGLMGLKVGELHRNLSQTQKTEEPQVPRHFPTNWPYNWACAAPQRITLCFKFQQLNVRLLINCYAKAMPPV